MSVITVRTRDLVGVLADAILTTSTDPEYPQLGSVLLDTTRGDVAVTYHGGRGSAPTVEGVTNSDILVATSTDGRMISQGHCACDGQLHMPVLLDALDLKDMVRMFTRLGRSAPKDEPHQTILDFSSDGVTISEDPQLCPHGSEMSFPALDLGEYPRDLPARMQPEVFTVVTDPTTGEDVPPSYGRSVSARAHEVIGKVASRQGVAPVWYSDHQRRGVIVEIGTMWRGLFPSVRLEPEQEKGPRVPVFVTR